MRLMLLLLVEAVDIDDVAESTAPQCRAARRFITAVISESDT